MIVARLFHRLVKPPSAIGVRGANTGVVVTVAFVGAQLGSAALSGLSRPKGGSVGVLFVSALCLVLGISTLFLPIYSCLRAPFKLTELFEGVETGPRAAAAEGIRGVELFDLDVEGQRARTGKGDKSFFFPVTGRGGGANKLSRAFVDLGFAVVFAPAGPVFVDATLLVLVMYPGGGRKGGEVNKAVS